MIRFRSHGNEANESADGYACTTWRAGPHCAAEHAVRAPRCQAYGAARSVGTRGAGKPKRRGLITMNPRDLLDPECFLFKYGRAFIAAALPKDIRKTPNGHSFDNSLRLATRRHPALTYAEGKASSAIEGSLIEHAWCVTPDGVVVDPTLEHPEQHEYFGVAFSPAALLRGLRASGGSSGFCMLWNGRLRPGVLISDHDINQGEKA